MSRLMQPASLKPRRVTQLCGAPRRGGRRCPQGHKSTPLACQFPSPLQHQPATRLSRFPSSTCRSNRGNVEDIPELSSNDIAGAQVGTEKTRLNPVQALKSSLSSTPSFEHGRHEQIERRTATSRRPPWYRTQVPLTTVGDLSARRRRQSGRPCHANSG